MGSITSRRTSIHECDADLLCRANRILEKRKLDLADAARLEQTIANYEIALRLARGPLPDRSQHWSERAKRLWAELDDLVWGLT